MSGLPAQGAITCTLGRSLPIKFVISVTSLPNNKLTLRLREWMPYADNLWEKNACYYYDYFFAAVLMLWCAQTAAYSGQCHTTQGNPYIGVNFGVKTLEEEENTAGVVKDKFYQWNESNVLLCFL